VLIEWVRSRLIGKDTRLRCETITERKDGKRINIVVLRRPITFLRRLILVDS